MASYCYKDLNELIAKMITSNDLEERYLLWHRVLKQLDS